MLALLLAAALATACAPEPTPAAPTRPNILLISLDALRADHLGCYGYDRPTSPFLDRLASRGTRFSHAWANTHGTPPSHTTMLSSLYQETHRVGYGATTPEGRDDSIPPEVELVQEMLRAAGWFTAGVTDGGYMSEAFGFRRGFDSFSDDARGVAQGTAMLLKRIRPALEEGRPVFAMYHTYEVHSPYQPPPEYRDLFGPFTSDIEPLSRNLVPIQNTAHEVLTRADFDFLEARYDGEIRYTDDVLRAFFDKLETNGFLDHALVIVTSDHGEEFGDHGGLLHRASLHEELLHVPLILFGSMVPGGVVDPRLVSLVDVTPTILDAAGLDPTPIMAGRSLLDRPPVESWPDQRSFAQYTSRLYAVRSPRWKLIQIPTTGRLQLYDLRRDPTERRNLAAQHPAEAQRLADEIAAWRRGLPTLELSDDAAPELSDETVEELEALGYITN